LAVIVVSVICWLPLIRGLTLAISRLTAATGQIANGQFDITLKLKRRDELGRLSESINQMAQRLAGLVHGQKRFLSDIAHELSSPVARMQVGLSILEQRADEEHASYVADVKEEVDHMSALVNELLSFSRSRIGEKQRALTAVLVSDLVDKVLVREGSGNVQISTSIEPNLTVRAHSECLYRALANIVRNAVRYAGSAGPITVSAKQEGEDVVISVADNGPGLPEKELETVFRPFYRPEFARRRETGGTGLGLAIVRDCVETCGGTVHCRNRLPHGLELTMQLPATR
jgi:two-component system, OmpR family, sensor histidine kinase CpxA